MLAAGWGKLDCLEYLVAKGAKLDARNKVRAGPPAAPSGPLRPSPSPTWGGREERERREGGGYVPFYAM